MREGHDARERSDLGTVSDDTLLRQLLEILKKTRHDEADLVAHIAEVDARKLYAREAAPSMFAWCTEVLHLSEQETYMRISVARASRDHPMLLRMLRDGRLHLSGIARLAPHLTRENREAVLERAAGMSYRQIQELICELEPKPDAPARIRKLPDRRAQTSRTEPPQLCAPRVASPTNEAATAGAAAPGSEKVPEGPRGAGPEPSSPDPRPDGAEPFPSRRATVEPLAPTALREWPWCAEPTTRCWPRRTLGGRRWRDTAGG